MTTSLETVPVMEALLLNCAAGLNLSLLLNNIWTWLAVMTAAVGLWRIRSIKPDLVTIPEPPVQDRTTSEPDRSPSTSTRLDDETAVMSPTKGNKYRACYSYCFHEEDEDENDENVVVEEEWRRGCAEAVVKEWRSAAAAGWYRYQDRRVLDGSVVRLWDHSSSSSPTRTAPLTRYLPLGL